MDQERHRRETRERSTATDKKIGVFHPQIAVVAVIRPIATGAQNHAIDALLRGAPSQSVLPSITQNSNAFVEISHVLLQVLLSRVPCPVTSWCHHVRIRIDVAYGPANVPPL
jgi:hypothetical protein